MGQSAEVMREEGIDEMGRRGEKRGRGGSWVRTSVLAYDATIEGRTRNGRREGKKQKRVVSPVLLRSCFVELVGEEPAMLPR